MGCRSDFLFAQPSALYGIARLFDLGSTFDSYNVSPTPAMADAWALFNDWCRVGQDLADAFPLAFLDTLQVNAGNKDLMEFLESDAGKRLIQRLEAVTAAR